MLKLLFLLALAVTSAAYQCSVDNNIDTFAPGQVVTFSCPTLAGEELVTLYSQPMVQDPNGDKFYVYLFNSGNYSAYSSGHSAIALNSDANTLHTTDWTVLGGSYTWPTADTYYMVTTCENTIESCSLTFNLMMNYQGMPLASLVLPLSHFF